MRRAVYDTINDVTGTLKSIGIDTSSDYTERGKLIIDETKLRNAITNNPDQVQAIFSKTSTSVPSYSATLSAADRNTRYREEGIANRLSDIIQDNIRTTRDSGGKKGILIEKAGLIGDSTELLNLIDKDIRSNNDAINDLIIRLNKKETAYYRKFTALEEYVSQMNAQSAWLAQQFSGN
jgi:flagellar hook-associated protein 2